MNDNQHKRPTTQRDVTITLWKERAHTTLNISWQILDIMLIISFLIIKSPLQSITFKMLLISAMSHFIVCGWSDEDTAWHKLAYTTFLMALFIPVALAFYA